MSTRASTERLLAKRLAADAEWAVTPVGRLAQLMLDHEVPVNPVAEYLGVAGVVLRRWLYGYNGQTFMPGGRVERRKEVMDRISLLCRVIPMAYHRDRLRAPWAENFRRTESDVPSSQVI